MVSIPDQQAMWDRKFQAGEHYRYREDVSLCEFCYGADL
jgi:hypothetical protein